MSNTVFRRTLRSVEKHFADHAEHREDKAITAHMAATSASIGKPAKRRHGHDESMPYRCSIALALAALASALTCLVCWYS